MIADRQTNKPTQTYKLIAILRFSTTKRLLTYIQQYLPLCTVHLLLTHLAVNDDTYYKALDRAIYLNNAQNTVS